MRFGGPIFSNPSNPQEWASALRAKGYRASFNPVKLDADDATIRAYAAAALEADIVIAEVGAWSNPISPDEHIRKEAVEKCKTGLSIADRIGARCCVNISGSRGAIWDGPDKDNLTPQTFDLIVATVQEIIDAVKPDRACYALETMPWMYPDSVESYAALMEAIDRPHFAVHFDPVNLICSPQRYFANAEMMSEAFRVLGPSIKGCHAKDISLSAKLTTHLEEVRPGLGNLDYGVFLGEMSRLDPDTPLMLEHLPSEAEYDLAAGHIRGIAAGIGIAL